ncbi:tubulin-tyrosine ligase family-domain-containing protein [Chytridium lagenaria]|nr:tubulin-tyrosine ligase family-domain-containing protein [Chytridium lagenaria]
MVVLEETTVGIQQEGSNSNISTNGSGGGLGLLGNSNSNLGRASSSSPSASSIALHAASASVSKTRSRRRQTESLSSNPNFRPASGVNENIGRKPISDLSVSVGSARQGRTFTSSVTLETSTPSNDKDKNDKNISDTSATSSHSFLPPISISTSTTVVQTQPQPVTGVVRFKTGLRNTVLDVMKDRSWKETDGELDWDFFWADVHWVHETFDHIYLQEHQRINHFRNHYELTRKDLLVKNVKRMVKTIEKEFGKAEAQKFDFVATSYALPQEHALFQEEFKRNPGAVWIMKPVGKAQGKGIFLINKMSQISQWRKDPKIKSTGDKDKGGSDVVEPPEAYIVQRYIDNPYLIGGKKFDIRTYVLVTSYYPLVVYIHRNGFCRFSNHQFTMNVKDISNLYIHATNVAIQKHSPNYDGEKGCKWLLRNLKTFLVSKHGNASVNELFTEMEALIVRSLMSVQKVMINDKHCFELYGYDILIDDNLKPWLLEVNASPSLSAETQFDYELKHAMLNDAFDVIDLEKR